jgi:hypothetical protein
MVVYAGVAATPTLLVVLRPIVIIRPSRESIGIIVRTRYVFQLIVKVFQKINISCHPSIYFLWMAVVLQVGIVY